MIPPQVIAAGASLIGGIFQNKSNQAVSAKQMAFQKQMSNTQYQRGMHDMKKAGLNPMLAYKQGGASAPAGAGIPMKNIAEGVPNAVNSATMLQRSRAEIDNLKSNAALNSERTNTEKAVQAANYANSALALQRTQTEVNNTETAYFNAEKAVSESGISLNNLSVSRRNAILASIEQQIDDSTYGRTILKLRRLKDLPGGSLFRALTKRGK